MAANSGEQKYLIPKRLSKKTVIAEGIGPKELGIVSIGILIGIILYYVSDAIFHNFFISLLLLIIPMIAVVILVSPDMYKENAIVKIKRRNKFNSSKKIYYFCRKEEYDRCKGER